MWEWRASAPPLPFCDLFSEIYDKEKEKAGRREANVSGGRKEYLQCLTKEAILLGLLEVTEQIHSSDKLLPQTY